MDPDLMYFQNVMNDDDSTSSDGEDEKSAVWSKPRKTRD